MKFPKFSTTIFLRPGKSYWTSSTRHRDSHVPVNTHNTRLSVDIFWGGEGGDWARFKM